MSSNFFGEVIKTNESESIKRCKQSYKKNYNGCTFSKDLGYLHAFHVHKTPKAGVFPLHPESSSSNACSSSSIWVEPSIRGEI
jgi:hypothetical protein